MWWFTGVVPTRLKKSRTVLIPKTSDAGAAMEVGNWRPITIGSMILRLFTRVITKRLADACPLHPRQRGFRPSPGCAENLEVLQGLIRHCKEESSPLAVVFVDFAQAFDTVSHEHILSALGQIKVDPHVVGLIQQTYADSCTSVEVGGSCTPDIKVRVGVKQGDPMSPLLFNLALDPLIHGLERFGKGYTVAGHQITSLAFADDLVLIGGSWRDMAHNLALLEEFCRNTGLRVQPKKCHSFLVRPCSGSFSVNDCTPWVLGGKTLQLTPINEAIRYLGIKFNPWGGVERPDLSVSLDRWCRNIGKAPLKPSQRVTLLNQYAIPRLFYQADLCEVSDGVLRNLDGTIRRMVKKWLHLPPSTCDGLLYSRHRDGGLGICKLSRHIPLMRVRRIYHLAHSPDTLVRNITQNSRVESSFKRSWTRAGGTAESLPSLRGVASNEGGNTTGSVTPHPVPCDWRLVEFQKWTGLATQGVGISGFLGSKASNSWLRKPVGFKERHYIAALQLRAGVYPTLEFRCRGRSKTVANCRLCSLRLETSSHILGQCPAMQRARIARHNKLCRLLGTEAEALGWEVRREWEFRTPQGRLRRLDLVLIRESLALVLDVTVRYEYAPDTLACAGKEKVDYYGPHKGVIARELGVGEVRVYGFPLGARGLWPSSNNKILEDMGLSKARVRSFSRLLSRRTILYSVDILRGFLSSLG
uniref:ribonuclease H n=1 Tax=Sinocyclocheilus rhinocerous TaxID=307959 RepID=A0A673FSA3_9TELE